MRSRQSWRCPWPSGRLSSRRDHARRRRACLIESTRARPRPGVVARRSPFKRSVAPVRIPRNKARDPQTTLCESEQSSRSSGNVVHATAFLFPIRRGPPVIIRKDELEDLPTPGSGVMRLHIVRPAGPGQFPGVLFFSEIYQVTEPIRRLAAMVAGQGYLVAMPEGTFPGGCIFSGRAAGRGAAGGGGGRAA